jgi:hypothetical protein
MTWLLWKSRISAAYAVTSRLREFISTFAAIAGPIYRAVTRASWKWRSGGSRNSKGN